MASVTNLLKEDPLHQHSVASALAGNCVTLFFDSPQKNGGRRT